MVMRQRFSSLVPRGVGVCLCFCSWRLGVQSLVGIHMTKNNKFVRVLMEQLGFNGGWRGWERVVQFVIPLCSSKVPVRAENV